MFGRLAKSGEHLHRHPLSKNLVGSRSHIFRRGYAYGSSYRGVRDNAALVSVATRSLQSPQQRDRCRANIQYSQSHRRFVYLCRSASHRNNIKSQCCRAATPTPTDQPLRLISNITCTTRGSKLSVHPLIVRVYVELRTRKQHFRWR